METERLVQSMLDRVMMNLTAMFVEEKGSKVLLVVEMLTRPLD